jgi:hypothetical protein
MRGLHLQWRALTIGCRPPSLFSALHTCNARVSFHLKRQANGPEMAAQPTRRMLATHPTNHVAVRLTTDASAKRRGNGDGQVSKRAGLEEISCSDPLACRRNRHGGDFSHVWAEWA